MSICEQNVIDMDPDLLGVTWKCNGDGAIFSKPYWRLSDSHFLCKFVTDISTKAQSHFCQNLAVFAQYCV